jgi:preprotein translocase subunit YajC
MIRLLITLLILTLSIYFMIFRQGERADQKPEILYQESLDKASEVEVLMNKTALEQKQRIDEATR